MPAPEEMVNVNPEDIQDQPIREITQTDHLNKKLLTSLLNRMNEGGNSTLAKMLEPDNSEEENDEWKD
ncbi:unnamed protein product [Euphydryas editha]|uniref:Uncharacterized protein n=1 Tax=Euphydryas editha TaxID=104508 RepID=A0AAU9UJD3_EUPED|nr:unnamed protein product [Euphydryas editha]